MFNPIAFVLNNTRTTLILYVLVLLTGYSTFNSIGRQEYPPFTIRNAQVITQYPGRTAEQVEKEVTEPLEQTIRQMSEVDTIRSTSKPGVSIVSIELEDTLFDLDPIWQDVRNRIDAVRLPDGAKKPQVNDDIGDVFPYVYAIKGDGYSWRELQDAAEELRDALLAVDGVAQVSFHGDQEERVWVDFNSSQMAANGVSPGVLGSALAAQNAVSSSGDVEVGVERLDLRTNGEFQSVQAIADYRLSPPGEATSIRVSDVASVSRGYVEPLGDLAHWNGERVLCFAVSMIEGGVVTEIGERIGDCIARTEATFPHGLDVETMFYQPTYVDKSIEAFVVNLGQAFGFVLIIMFVFAGWRIALIVGVLVPSAVMGCFTFMPSLGVDLEMMSIAALIIALGLLVDNAVVISEQILVRLGAGESRRDAVVGAVGNLTIPLLAASGTTIAAFSPIALAPGAISEFTYSLFAVVTLTLLCSWVLSLTIIPLLCYYFLKPLERDTLVGRGLSRLYDPYERVLRWTLRKGWLYPAVIVVLTVVAGWGFKFVPNIFFPPNERGQFVIDFKLPVGTSIAETERQVKELERWLLEEQKEQVSGVASWIGQGGPRWYLSLSPEPGNPSYALLSVLTKVEDPQAIRDMVALVNGHAVDAFPDARVTAKTLENGPPVGDPLQIRLYGEDMTRLYELRDQLMARIRSVEGTYDVRDDWGEWSRQLSITPDPVRSARLGLATSDVADALSLQFTGNVVTHFREGDRNVPVTLRTSGAYRNRPDRLPDVPVFGSDAGVVPLGTVADIDLVFSPGSILRENTLRVMTIKGRVHGRFASDALAEIRPLVDALVASDEWPVGYRIEFGGEQENSQEANGSIGAAMPISLSILSLILISQFNSIRRFVIIVCTIPPMLIGVTPGLLLTGSSFGFMTMLGLIALLGIIVNNAILLIDEIDTQRDSGLPIVEAIVASCRSRLRPIVMTTCTTIIGLGPLAVAGGAMWSSMAWAMMFGLGFATLLTLMLCPVLFFLFFRGQEA